MSYFKNTIYLLGILLISFSFNNTKKKEQASIEAKADKITNDSLLTKVQHQTFRIFLGWGRTK